TATVTTNQVNTQSQWKAKIQYLSTNTFNETVIGKLEFTHSSGKSMFKTLLVPVIDDSGSMSGSPIRQVRSSLDRLLDITYKNSHILTHMVTYGSNANNYEINKTRPVCEYRTKISNLSGNSGGTSFEAAFSEILKLCAKYKSDKSINRIVIVFLTDGEDSSVGKGGRINLVNKLKNDMNNACSIDYVVHTVGFGGSHDFDFLNSLRMIGTNEGAYRFADPSENDDSLFGKINSIIDAIAKAHSIPLKIKDTPFPIITDNKEYYWLNMSDVPLNEEHEITVSINDEDPIKIPLELESENGPELWDEYYTQLIDDIAGELLVLSACNESLGKQLHSELLEQRSKTIMSKLDKESQNNLRLEKILETIKIIRSGGSVSQLKLNDMKFEGKFATNVVPKNTQTPNTPSISHKKVNKPASTWETISATTRIVFDKNIQDVFYVIANYGGYSACTWLNNNVSEWSTAIDSNGANPLIVASSVGKIELVRKITNFNVLNINDTNNQGYNATDMAAMYGYWISYGILVENGGRPTTAQTVLRTCLSRGYFNTANHLINDGFAVVTEDLINSSPSNSILSWLSSKSVNKISVEDAILKGMFDIVKEEIYNITSISWKHYKEILVNPSGEHLQIIDLLLSKGKANANEEFEMDDGEISWPLFASCEKGNMALFEILLNYIDPNTVNKQN
ncbi:MAG: hypothetical protein C0448_16180, partial [Sphingobacteriaceae bacterium]|nr:hypothetical protein [Sphingobacteriaceae bacterium]